MTTTLKRFSDAYASQVVATYEPLILRWVSGWTLNMTAEHLAFRAAKAPILMPNPLSTALALDLDDPIPDNIRQLRLARQIVNRTILTKPLNAAKLKLSESEDLVVPSTLTNQPRFKNTVIVGRTLYPHGISREVPRAKDPASGQGNAALGALYIPSLNKGLHPNTPAGFEPRKIQKSVLASLAGAVGGWIQNQHRDALSEVLKRALVFEGNQLPAFFPVGEMEEELSPIGIAHYYRQHYFNTEEGVGPIEQAFTVAPLETLEVFFETAMRHTVEDESETGEESTLESGSESSASTEVSDKTASMVRRDLGAAFSASGSYSALVVKSRAKVSGSISSSRQANAEQSSRMMKGMTRRAAERITKKFSVRTRTVDEISTLNRTRRLIQNTSPNPVSYGLRRVLRKVRVVMQSLGPRLVWQTYIAEPGRTLARPQFVHFRTTDYVASKPAREMPQPGREEGSLTVKAEKMELHEGFENHWWIKIPVSPGPFREPTSLVIKDLQAGKPGKYHPLGVYNDGYPPEIEPGTGADTKYHFYVRVAYGDGYTSHAVVNYEYTYVPTAEALTKWKEEVEADLEKDKEEYYQEQFDREKALIAEKSRIRPRPSEDLRREERFTVMGRIVDDLFKGNETGSRQSPIEIEYFNRFFDVDGLFTFSHPAWWEPRLRAKPYEVTADSEPALLGSSLGWDLQLDGDRHRNAFINSPWVRACIPIREGQEREALTWLAEHIEGKLGFDLDGNPRIKKMVEEIEELREREGNLGVDGPDFIRVGSDVEGAPDPATPPGTYPVVDTFEVTVPTEGFVYERLKIDGDDLVEPPVEPPAEPPE